MLSSDENSNEPMDLYSYLESHFAFETVNVSPTLEGTIVDDHFKLYDNTLTTISLSNPYEYTVDNSRVYDFTMYIIKLSLLMGLAKKRQR
jgi:hypothetical protein